MPVKVSKRRGKFRVVEPGGKLARNKAGTTVDGGGHKSKTTAQKQCNAINHR